MNLFFEKFTEKHIEEAVQLALKELDEERAFCRELPNFHFEERLREILWWLGSQPYGKAALCDGKLVGYLLFAGPWDGFHGDVKGVFSRWEEVRFPMNVKIVASWHPCCLLRWHRSLYRKVFSAVH